MTSIGINNKETYQGFNLVPTSSMDETFKNSVADFDGYSALQNAFDIVNLNESDINNYLKTRNIFGNKYFLQREIENGKNKVNYIALDNAYINFLADKAIFSAGLNINGLETMITMPMNLDEDNSTGMTLTYSPDQLYFGSTPEDGMKLTLNPTTEMLIFKTLKEAMSGDVDKSFAFAEDGTLTISFDSIVNEAINGIGAGKAAYKAFLQNPATHFGISVVGDKVTDNSVIKISASQA